MNAKLLSTLGLFVAVTSIAVGCSKPREEAKPDETQKELPALSKPAVAPGDGKEPAQPAKAEAKTSDPAEHGAEPVRKDDADDDGEEEATKHEGRHRASSGPATTHDRAADKTSALTLKRILFSEAIDKREPAAAEETFSAKETDKVYAFVELGNPSKEKSHVTVTFIPPMGSPSKVELDVGNKPRWRTWAKKSKPRAVGTWTVVVTDDKGAELGRRTFEVTE